MHGVAICHLILLGDILFKYLSKITEWRVEFKAAMATRIVAAYAFGVHSCQS